MHDNDEFHAPIPKTEERNRHIGQTVSIWTITNHIITGRIERISIDEACPVLHLSNPAWDDEVQVAASSIIEIRG